MPASRAFAVTCSGVLKDVEHPLEAAGRSQLPSDACGALRK
jgi:hypothetical protein